MPLGALLVVLCDIRFRAVGTGVRLAGLCTLLVMLGQLRQGQWTVTALNTSMAL